MIAEKITYQVIGKINSPHKSTEGSPIQPVGAKNVTGEIKIKNEFIDGLKDLDGFSHIIVVYHFHKVKGVQLKVKPFLDKDEHGIFATRAPKRPNPIGMSVLKLIKIENNILFVENIDILDGTPVLDIKPYVSKFDFVENEKNGWLINNINNSDSTKSDDRFSGNI